MKKIYAVLLLAAVTLSGCSSKSDQPMETQTMTQTNTKTTVPETKAAAPAGEWRLVWSDDFEGTGVDPAKWTYDTGNGFTDAKGNFVPGWGNNEKQTYTDRLENARVADGNLQITALQEEREGFAYTSARLKTKGLYSAAYGKFEMRARLPAGKGLWPAFWLLPEDNQYGTWAASGEIDIMEAKGSHPTGTSGAVHFGSQWPNNLFITENNELTDGTTIEDFHVYSLEWEPGVFRWFVDGIMFKELTKGWYSGSKRDDPANPPFPAPFDQPFHLLMNLAVGGNFDGDPWPDTKFPAVLTVDYVKVYQRP